MPTIEVTHGELIDKWTILQIKKSELSDPKQLDNITIEMSRLYSQVQAVFEQEDLQRLHESLYEINKRIWQLMEDLYSAVGTQTQLISLTLEITKKNQDRALIKKEIDRLCNSDFSEAKSYFENPDFLITDIDS